MPRRKSVTFELSESDDENIADSDFESESETASRLKRRRRQSPPDAQPGPLASTAEDNASPCAEADAPVDESPPRRPRRGGVYEVPDADEITTDREEDALACERELKLGPADELTPEPEAADGEDQGAGIEFVTHNAQEDGGEIAEVCLAYGEDGNSAGSRPSRDRSGRAGKRNSRGSDDGSDAGSEWDVESEYGASDDSAAELESDYEEVELKKTSKTKRSTSGKAPSAPKKQADGAARASKGKAGSATARPASKARAKEAEAEVPNIKSVAASLGVKKKLGGKREVPSNLASRSSTTPRDASRASGPSVMVSGPRLRVGLSRNARVPRLHSYLEK
jgi:hypothetical protein